MVAVLTLVGLGAFTVAAVAWSQGYRVYIIHTGSMLPDLRPGSVVVDRPLSGAVRVGEIISYRFRAGPDGVLTHRVYSDRAGVIVTKGDANSTPDPWTTRRGAVVGTPDAVVPRLGYLLEYLKQPAGVASVVTLVATVGLLWTLLLGPPAVAAPPRRVPAHRRRKRPLHAMS